MASAQMYFVLGRRRPRIAVRRDFVDFTIGGRADEDTVFVIDAMA